MESEAAELVGLSFPPSPTYSPCSDPQDAPRDGDDTGDLQDSSLQDTDAVDFHLPKKKMLPHSDSCAQQFLWIKDE